LSVAAVADPSHDQSRHLPQKQIHARLLETISANGWTLIDDKLIIEVFADAE